MKENKIKKYQIFIFLYNFFKLTNTIKQFFKDIKFKDKYFNVQLIIKFYKSFILFYKIYK